MSFELYRQTMMGDCLVEALEEMMAQNKISEELALTITNQFDASMLDALRNHVTARAHIKANLKTYRFFDNDYDYIDRVHNCTQFANAMLQVWQFMLENVNFKLPPSGTGPQGGTADAQEASHDQNLVEEPVPERTSRTQGIAEQPKETSGGVSPGKEPPAAEQDVGKPDAAKSITPEPAAAEPAAEAPAEAELAAEAVPAAAEPASERADAPEPAAPKPADEAPAVAEPAAEQPAQAEPAVADPAAEQPAEAAPAAEADPAAEQP
ncbi:hypothetical protein QJQ45_015564, partial [Haematococcus lacustris]